MRQVITAKTAGFCYGVKRAIEMAMSAGEECDRVYTLGPLIHNDDAVKELEHRGVRCISSADEANSGDTVIIRSHGVAPEIYDRLSRAGANIIDATCPSVARVHDIARRESEEGRLVVIIGDPNHAEVVATAGWCSNSLVFRAAEEIEHFIENYPDFAQKSISIIAQTTAERRNFENCIKILKNRCTNAKIFDTICSATNRRQDEARNLASECDGMIVIGGHHSANSRHLAQICSQVCSNVAFIENATQLNLSQFKGCYKIGITAGASTPEWIIKEVNQTMNDEIIVNETEQVEEIHEETFAEMLEKTFKTLHTGGKVTGVVTAITATEVTVDLGAKQSGYILLSELTDDPTVKVEDVVKVGDEIETFVMRVNDADGTVMLSKKRLDAVKAWDDINEAKNSKAVLEGKVVESNKGGVVVMIKGIRVFVPASQTGLPKETEMTTLVGETVKLRVTEVNQSRRRVVGSIRAVQYEERKAKAAAIWDTIEEGKHYTGTVKSMTSYGAFVDIGGIDGMVHVSELSWNRIHQPSDVLTIGQEVDVYVISFDAEKRKISLGYRTMQDNPWVKFTTNYAVGEEVEVKIVKLMTFGAFAQIIPGVDGLIHISQIADRRIAKTEDVLTVGQTVNVRITDIDNDKKKVSLSIRALLAAPAAEEAPVAEDENDGDALVYDTDHPTEVE